ncbi:hypothetical protein PR202_ga23889 [Eleusine coracana subsp. coracana]|uniref:Uncharacterized protein n=1 Tax=Eleusine coracana subsp. coracana TaxID=191504 RepID=A0AAV5D7G2_ELECO|nr:hypothetical protein PR202_ga23889 [Eleusine coracana subsp. coracana]
MAVPAANGIEVEEGGAEQQQEAVRAPRPPLAVEALREKIVEKVKANRVTLIVGDTGCGKSTLVPQYLLEENMEPVLCTQPRRFAVVAIARAIAESRNWQLGEEVGYHIGHSNVSDLNDKRSKLVFKTAGVVLEQMCDRGVAALLKYKVIILDEVHERSVESDLILAGIKQFLMKRNDLRLVLMSATVDITRYKEYFRDIGRGERVEIADILNINSQSLSTKYCNGPDASADADLNSDVYELIHKLLLHIHQSEPDISKSILVFLPTYYALEQQWIRLLPLGSTFKVHILHRSIDTDEALQTMKVSKSHRKVILATNIAESSVTIPGVAYVIDSCRSLQVYWDPIRKTDAAGLVWISQSQAEQRKGRTGRTCDGQIYRLVTGKFYRSLNDHEYPAILRLSLREQVLMVCCAEPRSMNDPSVLLQRALSPPDPDAIEDALESLVQIRALTKTSGRYEPTFYGCLLNSLPLSFDSSVLTLKFGELGLLHEGILISIMLDIQPLPILQPFGYQALDKHRLEYLKEVAKTEELEECLTYLAKLEEEWCATHNLSLAALKTISDIYFGTGSIVGTLNALVKEVKMQHVQEKTIPDRAPVPNRGPAPNCGPVSNWGLQHGAYGQPALETEICVFFANGSCNKGTSCRFSHSSSAPKPVCKFFLTLQGCRNDGNGHILVMNDKSLEFSKKLCQYYDAAKIVACTPSDQSTESDSVQKGLKILRNLADPSLLMVGREHELPVPWTKVQRVIWFADFDNDESSTEQVLLQKFLQRMSIKILSEPLFDLQVILIMKNTKFIYLESTMFSTA